MTRDKRTVLQECIRANPHSPPSPDAILNALHQAGWAVVPKAARAAVWEDDDGASHVAGCEGYHCDGCASDG